MTSWKLLITKSFFRQFITIEKTKRTFIIDSLDYIVYSADLGYDKLDIDIVDEYDGDKPSNEPFPITHVVDTQNKKIHLICIEQGYLDGKYKLR